MGRQRYTASCHNALSYVLPEMMKEFIAWSAILFQCLRGLQVTMKMALQHARLNGLTMRHITAEFFIWRRSRVLTNGWPIRGCRQSVKVVVSPYILSQTPMLGSAGKVAGARVHTHRHVRPYRSFRPASITAGWKMVGTRFIRHVDEAWESWSLVRHIPINCPYKHVCPAIALRRGTVCFQCIRTARYRCDNVRREHQKQFQPS